MKSLSEGAQRRRKSAYFLLQLSEILDGSDHLAGVGVLVVVPGNNLNLIETVAEVADHGLGSIKERTEAHTDNVGGNDGILVVAEGLGSGGLHSGQQR